MHPDRKTPLWKPILLFRYRTVTWLTCGLALLTWPPCMAAEPSRATCLMQAQFSRAPSVTLDGPWNAVEDDQAHWDDFVSDDLHGAGEAVKVGGLDDGLRSHMGEDGVMNVSPADPWDDDSDFLRDDYGDGVASRLCWSPPPKPTEKNKKPHEQWQPTFAPIDAKCPPECPYSQELGNTDEDSCKKACVRAEHCKILHPYRVFGDNETKSCTVTCGGPLNFNEDGEVSLHQPAYIIPGCVECAGRGKCNKCIMWRSLINNGRECKDYWKYVWTVLHVIAIVLIVAAGLFLLYLQLRPTLSPEVMTRAYIHREMCKPWRFRFRRASGNTEAQTYKMTTVTHSEDVSGIGIMLYFRWGHLLFCFSMVLLVVLYLTFHVSLAMVTDWGEIIFDGAASNASLENGNASLGLTTRPDPCHWNFSYVRMEPSDYGMDKAVSLAQTTRLGWADKAASLAQAPLSARGPGLRIRMKHKPRVRIKAKAKMPVAVRTRSTKKKNKKKGEEISEIDTPAGDPKLFPRRMAFAAVMCYLALTAASLGYSWSQASFTRNWRKQHRQHSDFTVIAEGLPRDATDPDQLAAFFQAALDSRDPGLFAHSSPVVGVSIAYDFTEQSKKLATLQDYYYRLQDKVERIAAKSMWGDIQRRETSSESMSPSAQRRTPKVLQRIAASKSFRPLDWLVYRLFPKRDEPEPVAAAVTTMQSLDGAAEEGDGDAEAEAAEDYFLEGWEDDAREELEKMECSGIAYVVLSSEKARARLVALSGLQGPEECGPVTLRPCDVEPPSVIWEAHGHVPTRRMMARNLFMLAATVIVWALMFAPYAFYHISADAIPGEEVGAAADFVLGMLIAVGNQLVTVMIDMNVHHLGYRNKQLMDATSMALVYLATLFNTGLDMFIVLVALRGINLDLALYGTVDQTHYDRVLAREFYALIMPGYLITPYFIGPLIEDVLPRFVNSRLVRSTSGIPVSVAERKMMCPSFDLSWHYSDLLTNFSVCLPVLLFETHYMYTIMFYLGVCNMLNYCIDHFRLLRCTSESFTLSSIIADMFSFWWSLPLGLLGMIAVHWAMSAGVVSLEWECIWQIVFIVSHFVIYCGTLAWIRKPKKLDKSAKGEKDAAPAVSYKEMRQDDISRMRFFNYFNTNPVQVLRSWLLTDSNHEVPPGVIVPSILGKEYFMLLDPELSRQDNIQRAMRSRFAAARHYHEKLLKSLSL